MSFLILAEVVVLYSPVVFPSVGCCDAQWIWCGRQRPGGTGQTIPATNMWDHFMEAQ